MLYHSLVLRKAWSEVEPNTQTLILASTRVARSGFIIAVVAIAILSYISLTVEGSGRYRTLSQFVFQFVFVPRPVLFMLPI